VDTDVHQGAPAPVTGYVATVSKGAMFALLLRYFHSSGGRDLMQTGVMILLLAIASMVTGNLLAPLQNNVKRILGFSSIARGAKSAGRLNASARGRCF
jgi:NADH-quinone oxidoreductase subunit N